MRTTVVHESFVKQIAANSLLAHRTLLVLFCQIPSFVVRRHPLIPLGGVRHWERKLSSLTIQQSVTLIIVGPVPGRSDSSIRSRT